MKFSTVAVAASAVAVASAAYANTTTVFDDVYTTYCPTSGLYTIGNSTYTVTEPTTITITSCGCTEAAPTVAAVSSGNVSAVTTAPVEGAAGKLGLASGALAGVVAAAAYFL